MHIIRNANSLLHADSFAEIGALICKIFKQAFGRNTWLPVGWSIPGKCTLSERQIIFWMQIFLQRLELEFASFISNKLGGTLDYLLHEVYLENAHYWKGKLTFACSLFAEIGALICKVYMQAFWRNTRLPVAWSIPGKCTLLERQIVGWMQIFLQRLEVEFPRFMSKKLGGTLDFLLHEVYLENTHY